MILIYVDDILISYQIIMKKKKNVFEIGEEGDIDYYLGIKIIDMGEKV